MADDWNNLVSYDWKQCKIKTEEYVVPKIEHIQIEQGATPTSTIKDFIKLIFYSFLIFSAIIGILGFLVFITKHLPTI